MEKDLLQAVIKVESEIQQSIESERKKAAEWLESVRVSLSSELESSKQQMENEFRHSLETTCQECQLKAEKEISDVDRLVEFLQNVPHNVQEDAVLEFLRNIIPTEER